MKTHEYKGYRIMVRPLGPGWIAAIYRPGSTMAEADMITSDSHGGEDHVIDIAKGKIDSLIRHG